MSKKMAAPGSYDAAAKGEGKNGRRHHHHHHHDHRAQTAAPADSRVDRVAPDIDDRSRAYIEHTHRRFEDEQEMIMKNNTSSSTTTTGGAQSLTSLNYFSLVCGSVGSTLEFYQNVLGFIPIRMPESPKFDGAWLFKCGLVIHLLQSEDPEGMPRKSEINPKDNRFSFQCESMAAVEGNLNDKRIRCIKRTVEEGGISVDQLFFHDPDGFMIEISNREVLHDIPITGGDPVLVCKRATAAATCSSTP